jgi:hypothetical protein
MCLELFNQLVGLGFAGVGLAVFTLALAVLAAARFLGVLGRNPDNRQSPGFTCPCYAPPVASDPEDHQ